MDKDLTRYLNDHLAGSSGAILLIQEPADSHDVAEAREFFLQLKQEMEADRSVLDNLIETSGQKPSTFHKVAGKIAARVAGVKLIWEQVEPGKLGIFEALEMLALGVHASVCYGWHLWKSLDLFPNGTASILEKWNYKRCNNATKSSSGDSKQQSASLSMTNDASQSR